MIARRPWPGLLLLTLACLLPFSGKAVHMDDPLFLWSAKQIVQHPLNPYGFSLIWYRHQMPMWQITQNPPLASYYAALLGRIAGWSARALHLGFILPALVAVLSTYYLARRLTQKPFLAAAASLLAPGFLVSATGLMCDVIMLALWILAILCWLKGLEEPASPSYLLLASLLIAACALTKYFGVSLIPLLFVYSLVRLRRVSSWLWYLLIPVVLLGGYELYTHHLYGVGLIWRATHYATPVRQLETRAGRALAGLTFVGGCALPALLFVPTLWSRRQVLWGMIVSAFIGLCFYAGWINLGSIYVNEKWFSGNRLAITLQLIFYVAGAISLLALAIADYLRKKDPDSLLLLLWIAGTLFFAVALNWTVNARSILPIIPAVGILIARRLDLQPEALIRRPTWAILVALITSAAVSLWVAAGDAALADTAREMAAQIQQKTRSDSGTVRFEGHWGFQYYMEAIGAHPLDADALQSNFGDLAVMPLYNTSIFPFPLKTTAQQIVDLKVNTWVTTMNPDAGAGFYFSGWGPLPFAFGRVPDQRYYLARVMQTR